MNNGEINFMMKAPPLFQTLVPSSSRPTTPALKPASDHILTPFRLPQLEARRARRILIARRPPENRVCDFCAPLQLSSPPETRFSHSEMSIHLPSPDDVSPAHSARVLAAPLHIPPIARVSIDNASPPSYDLTPKVCPSVAPPSCNVSPSSLPLICNVSPPPSPK
ncbi:hypothetical protein Salat_2418200 [Sesamum alatum]|uniref:Uncharacterized protein n=1 Tax=Sesamum alatum TaxID=300844 RepID=A0AAE1XXR9_9LAMI|nr:hypothetical protein Salat_2418200 [Sesamum alatum]